MFGQNRRKKKKEFERRKRRFGQTRVSLDKSDHLFRGSNREQQGEWERVIRLSKHRVLVGEEFGRRKREVLNSLWE